MSQKTRIMRMWHVGAPAIIDNEPTHDARKIAEYNADVFRARFNDCRAHRASRKYRYYVDDYGNEIRGRRRPAVDDIDSTLHWSQEDIALGGPSLTGAPMNGDTTFKEKYPWAAGACSTIINISKYIENKEWGSALKRIKTSGGRTPEFKLKNKTDSYFSVARSAVNFYQSGKKTYVVQIKGGGARKSNKWLLKFRVRSSQPIREFSQIQVNLTKNQIVFTNAPQPLTGIKHDGSVVGIDRGVAHTLTTSEGNFFDAPKLSAGKLKKYKNLQRKLARQDRVNGSKKFESNRRNKTLREIANISKYAANSRETFNHQMSTHFVKNYDLVVLEDLKIQNMTKSAKGTVENPGTNVKAKSGLNRSILSQNWGQFEEFLAYKSELAGTLFEKVHPAYTSQQCSACGYISKENRKSQASFQCVKCNHTQNADHNAAINILHRFLGASAAEHAVEHGGAKAPMKC